jgi:hypothetical protein
VLFANFYNILGDKLFNSFDGLALIDDIFFFTRDAQVLHILGGARAGSKCRGGETSGILVTSLRDKEFLDEENTSFTYKSRFCTSEEGLSLLSTAFAMRNVSWAITDSNPVQLPLVSN